MKAFNFQMKFLINKSVLKRFKRKKFLKFYKKSGKIHFLRKVNSHKRARLHKVVKLLKVYSKKYFSY